MTRDQTKTIDCFEIKYWNRNNPENQRERKMKERERSWNHTNPYKSLKAKTRKDLIFETETSNPLNWRERINY
jgi:hypothetical protein